jgi:NTP pyrophosphatase (non-canonical NTP hydrolase)
MAARIEIKKIQEEIVANRKRRGFASAKDLSRTTLGLVEEVGEFERARRNGNALEMVDALCDIAIYCLGGFEFLGRNAYTEIATVVAKNKLRPEQKAH